MAVDKAVPFLRQSELNENSTRYDINLAAPPDEQLVRYWVGWAGVALTSGMISLLAFIAILTSPRRIRKQSFNMYLIYLMIPDFTFSLLCGTTCLLNAINGSYWSHWMCNFQQWYCVWGVGSNCWLNACITFELHKLLKFSNQRRRYTIPSRKTVTLQAIGVYIYCAFLGTWGIFEKDNFPMHSYQSSGLACIPVESDKASSLFFWIVFLPIFFGIPIVYVLYVCFDIWRRKLLPPSGKRRLLALYFGRIIIIFIALWGPHFLLNYVLATWLPTWLVYLGGTLSHLQGAASVAVSLLKPDIAYAVKRFVRCQCCDEDANDDIEGSEEFREVGDHSGKSRSIFHFVSSTLYRSTGFVFSTSSQTIQADVSETHDISDEYRSVWPDEHGRYSEEEGEGEGEGTPSAESNVLEEGITDSHNEVDIAD